MVQLIHLDMRCKGDAFRLIQVMETIQQWALTYQQLVRKLLERILASDCTCCNGKKPHHRDTNDRVAESRRKWNEIDTLMREVSL